LRLTSVAQMDRPVIALVLITLVAPLMSFAGICLPRKSQQAFSVLMMSIATLAALGLFINQWNISNDPVRIAWFAVGTLSFDADLIVSNQSLLMLVVVAFISLLVHIYSTTYMKDDSGQKRYFAMRSEERRVGKECRSGGVQYRCSKRVVVRRRSAY